MSFLWLGCSLALGTDALSRPLSSRGHLFSAESGGFVFLGWFQGMNEWT